MAFCIYKVIDLDGKELQGKCWCTNRNDLAKAFRDKGYYLVIYKELHNLKWNPFKKRLSKKDLSILCHQFASMLSVGINIFEVISIIVEESTNKYLIKCLIDIEYMVKQGVDLSSSMNSYSNIFPKFMIDMIRIGEESGTLEKVFEELSEYYNRENVLKNKVIKALIYPSIIFIVSIIVIQMLFIFIIPIFISTINELGGSVPRMTAFVLSISSFLRRNFITIILLMILTIITAAYFKKLDNITLLIHRYTLKSIFIKAIAGKLIAVKFSRVLGILLNSGIPIIKALDVTKNIIGNEYVKSLLEKSIDSIKSGSTFSKAINRIHIFPAMLGSMTRIGEESGSLGDMLTKASNMLEEELHSSIEKLTSIIEPILIIFLSTFIGSVLITLLVPMFNVMDAI